MTCRDECIDSVDDATIFITQNANADCGKYESLVKIVTKPISHTMDFTVILACHSS